LVYRIESIYKFLGPLVRRALGNKYLRIILHTCKKRRKRRNAREKKRRYWANPCHYWYFFIYLYDKLYNFCSS